MPPKPSRTASLSGLLVFALLSTSAHAFQPPDDSGVYEIDRRGAAAKTARHPAVQARLSRGAAWTSYLERNTGWTAVWSEADGRLVSAGGPALPAPGAAVLSEAAAVERARAFLAAEMKPWVPEDAGLDFVKSAGYGSGRWVHFRQSVNGVPVHDARVTVRMTSDGRVTQVANRAFPDLAIDTTPVVTAENARGLATTGLPGDLRPAGAPGLEILPVNRASGSDFRLAWRVEDRTADPPGHWITFVDAVDGTILWRYNNVRYADVTGVVNADVEPEQANSDFELTPLPYIEAFVQGPGDTTSALSGVDGVYHVATPDTANRSVLVRLAGPYGRVWNVANPQAPTTPQLTKALPDGSSAFAAFKFDESNSLVSERDAYYHVMVSHDYIQTVEPGFDLLDYPVPIAVEVNGSCNAFWDGYGVNFFAADNRCTNAARSATVVMHEYGHGITDYMYRPFAPSGAMHEGFSDYYAATITNQPIMGAGFNKSGARSYIRRIDEDRIAPDDLTGEVHNDGLVIASALWDIREALGRTKTDELWHFACYGFAENFDDYAYDVLVTDDDDGNVYNGTPNFTVLANTFRKHGIGDFAVHIAHVPTPDTEDPEKAFPITASFLSLYAIDPSTVTLHWTIAGGGDPFEMTDTMAPTGGVREYTFTIPNQASGTTVSYWLTAEDTTGTVGVFPPGGAADPVVFHIGPDAVPPVIDHAVLPDQPLDSPPVLVRAGMKDNLDKALHATRLIHRAPGQMEITQEMTALGGDRYQGEIDVNGLLLGDLVEYRLEAVDSAAVPLTTDLPDTGWLAFHMVRGLARDFEEDDGGLTGSGDWAAGDPAPVTTAYSGMRVWATSPSSNYTDNTVSDLMLPPVDMSAWAYAGLTFHHWLDCEPVYDGGRIDVSIDQGATWTTLVPDGGYTLAALAATGKPGFTGDIDWSRAEFDLSQYAGLPDVRLRLRFASDQGVNGPGWYVDDLQVVERQIPVRPLTLRAGSGHDGTVPLAWDLPPGVVEGEGSALTGYNVYRAESPDATPQRLNAEPLTSRGYSDGTVTNGTVYDYYVSAMYGAIESPLTGPVEAFPYRAAYASNRTSVSAAIDSVNTATDAITLSNGGSGPLRVAVYRADTGEELDDVRIRLTTGAFAAPRPAGGAPSGSLDMTLAEFLANAAQHKAPARPDHDVNPPGTWDTLFVDTQEGNVVPDLSTLEVQQTDDLIWFRTTAWANWGNPLADFNFILSIDTDGDRSDGFLGGEFVLVTGPLVLNAFGAPAMLVDSDFTPVEFPHHLVLTAGTAAAAAGIRKSSLGLPGEIGLALYAVSPNAGLVLDHLPDAPDARWFAADPQFIEVEPGSTGDVTITFASNGLDDGTYTADLLLETNDPAMPSVRIPATLDVTGMVPVVLSDFAAVPAADGMALSWSTSSEIGHLGFHVWRKETAPVPGDEVRVSTSLLTSEDGRYAFVDTGVEPGRTYAYRLADVSRTGVVTFHGPFTAVMSGEARPDRIWLAPAFPNPARGPVTIRFGIPAAGGVALRVFDIEGRLVRTIADEVMPAGFAERAWDGRDDGGRSVASGIYFYRLDAGGKRTTRKLLISR